MADFGSPVAQNVNPNAGIQTLQSILGIKQAQQNLQTGAIQQQRAQAAATVDTQTAKENQALASLLHDPVAAGIVDKDGNPTAAGESIILKAAPTTGAESFGKIVNAARSKVDFNNSVNSLNQNERAEIGSTLSGAAAGGDLDAVQTAAQQLLDSKAGTATYDDYKRILNTTMQVVTKQAQISPQAGLQAALGMGREVIGANAVVGSGGIANRATIRNAAGQTQLQNPITGAISNPEMVGGATNPASPQVAGQTAAVTTRAVGSGNADIDLSNQVVASQRNAKANIDLTKRIDQLADIVNPGTAAEKVSQALGALNISNVNQARTELQKDLDRLKGSLAERAQSDTRAGPILDSIPDSTKPTDTIHQAMDITRGFSRQDLALGKLQSKSSKETGGNMNGFQGDYSHAVSAASPLMHEYLSLSPQEQVGFFRRNFKTKAEAKAFRDQAESVRKRSPDVVGQ